MKIFETDRLSLRRLDTDDAAFILELLNDPAWLRFIGDKGVNNLEDARDYIRNGPMAMYERVGFGLFLVETKAGGAPIGICGLLKRDTLEDVDIGFAFLPGFRSQGYAHEATAATLDYAKATLGLDRVIAITVPDNHACAKLLEKIGMRFESMQQHGDDAHAVRVFAIDF